MALSLEISTNATEFPYEKKFPASLKLKELKSKLELIVGAAAEDIKVELRDSEGKFVAALADDTRSLQDLGVKNGMRIHAVDSTGANEDLKDDSMVEKYEMSDDKYAEREDSVRAWKKKMMMENKQNEEEAARMAAQTEAAERIKVGSRCEVRIKNQMTRRGEVAFIGKTSFKDGVWVGVKYDEPVGKNDGSVAGERYFQCMDKFGGFVRPLDVVCGDFPEESIDDMDEI